ncbi:hypothetical protein [Novosphingobium sp.]|uniref:hypothetical protein n=1 Tax=Novosphingobium sp. TaxID=1874826 RepID=UPI003B52801A
MIRRFCAIAFVLAAGCARDTALIDFRHELAAHDSATLALEVWCARAGIANPAHVDAANQDDADALPATPAIRAMLAVGAGEPVRVRHVLLSCGGVVLSDARNWYVPGRLTPAMNQTLETTRMPFGKVVVSLGLHRHYLTSSPASCPAGTIQHNTAVLRRDDGVAYSLVSECYTRANIARRSS